MFLLAYLSQGLIYCFFSLKVLELRGKIVNIDLNFFKSPENGSTIFILIDINIGSIKGI